MGLVGLRVRRRSRSALSVCRSEERRVGKEWRSLCDWSSDVCSSDLTVEGTLGAEFFDALGFTSHPNPLPQGERGREKRKATRVGRLFSFKSWKSDGTCGVACPAAEPLGSLGLQIGRASCRERVEITV